MSVWHIALALFAATAWGISFVFSKIGLESFTPAELTALRFLVASAAVLFVPRPKVPLSYLFGIGLSTFTAQFLFQFFGLALGMPPGLTAIVVHTQSLFTVLFVAVVLHELPSKRQLTGLLLTAAGLCFVAMTVGGDISIVGFVFCILSAISWAAGNVMIKKLPDVNIFHLMVWASLVPPLPALLVSAVLDGPGAFWQALTQAPAISFAVPVYLGIVATVWAFSVWGNLLQRYSAGALAPFALMAPCVGIGMSGWLLGEEFGPLRLFGIFIMLLGLAIAMSPPSFSLSKPGHQ